MTPEQSPDVSLDVGMWRDSPHMRENSGSSSHRKSPEWETLSGSTEGGTMIIVTAAHACSALVSLILV